MDDKDKVARTSEKNVPSQKLLLAGGCLFSHFSLSQCHLPSPQASFAHLPSFVFTSVTHLDQAISLDIFVKTCVVLGPLAIYFFALGRKYIIVLDEKCLTMNILTGNIWVVILC